MEQFPSAQNYFVRNPNWKRSPVGKLPQPQLGKIKIKSKIGPKATNDETLALQKQFPYKNVITLGKVNFCLSFDSRETFCHDSF